MIDATHPYAAAHFRQRRRRVRARRHVALASFVRPAWRPAARRCLADRAHRRRRGPRTRPRRRDASSSSLGRQELHFFAAISQHHYVARLIEPPQGARPHDLVLLRQRGPFDRDAELSLLKERKIDVIVSRNSGGSATYPKIEAARILGLPVIMIARPAKPAGHIVTSAEAAVAWLAHDGARSLRGV